jgi:hypothetical protein
MENETAYCHALYMLENALFAVQSVGPTDEVFSQAKRDVLAAIAHLRREHTEVVLCQGETLHNQT